ncbi:transglutaminase family protein [Nitrospina sp. 32_T5]|uniref:transglutaminase family protein n=1 Tax=unclassified Nitrospina TaxID=2638683 RepID=UPI003F9D0861
MLFRIEHAIRYIYSDRAYIEPMTIRLRPRSDCWQMLHKHSLDIEPAPNGMTESVDLEGNSVTSIWSTGLLDRLSIKAVSQVETAQENPFNFIINDSQALSLPIKYDAGYGNALDPYITREYSSDDVHEFANALLKEFGTNTTSFLTGLNQYLHENFHRVLREQGEPLHPSALLKTREGACRDLTVLFMDVCRVLGMATRFTSGYFFGDDDGFDQHELHAWAEVYLPGGGWRGYDPTHGLAVADRHVAMASACKSSLTAPTSGTYRGTGVTSSLEYNIQISRIDALETHNADLMED